MSLETRDCDFIVAVCMMIIGFGVLTLAVFMIHFTVLYFALGILGSLILAVGVYMSDEIIGVFPSEP